MSRTIPIPGLPIALFSLGLGLAHAQEAGDPGPQPGTDRPAGVIELLQQANSAHASGDYGGYLAAVQSLHELRPYNSEYMYQAVLGYALTQDRQGAYNMMLKMQQSGLAADFDQAPEAEFIRGTEAYTYINDLLKIAGQPIGEVEALFELPPEALLMTSIVWDPGREAFLMGSARNGVVYAVDHAGATTELLRADADNGLWGIHGLLVDPQRNRLWVASSADANFTGFRREDAGRAALVEFDLESLEPVKRYPVPADGRPHRLSSLAMTPAGDIYAVDGIYPFVYRLLTGGERLQPFVASGDLVSLRGITVNAAGTLLYIADYEMGILTLDLEGQRAMKLQPPANFNLGGIEDVLYWNGHLVVIQSGITPQRIMRLELADDGISVTRVAPLAVAQPMFDHPNSGTVREGELYFFANSHWKRSPGAPAPIRVARSPVSEAPDLVAPDMEKIWENYQQSSRRKAAQEGD